MPHDNSGSAFPLPLTSGPNDQLYTAYMGMTLRDYFAGQALMGLLANPKELSEGNEEGWSYRTGSLVGDAYQFADQMLEARK